MKKFKSVFLVLIMLMSLCLSGCMADTPKGDIPAGAVQAAVDSSNEKGDGGEGPSAEQKTNQPEKDSQADQQGKNAQDSPGTAAPSQNAAAKPAAAPSASTPATGSGQGASGSSNAEKSEAPSVPAVAAAPTPEAAPTPDPKANAANTVTISINCQTAVDKGLHLDEKFKEVVPADGVILAPLTVEFKDGETAFDILKRVVREHKIHMEYEGSKGTPYIQGINNLYEFDGGPLAGWMYCVNKVYSNYGCGEYKVKPGDKIEWNYTCNLGEDLRQT